MRTTLIAFLVLAQSLAQAEDPSVRENYSVDLVLKDGSKFHKEVKDVPYVTDNVVTIFPGESFSIGVELEGDKIKRIFYDKEKTSKFGIDLKFKQEDVDPKEKMTMLTVESRLPKTFSYQAFMFSVRDKTEETSVLPIEAGLACFESWPYPIMKIQLKNFKLEDAK